MMRWVLRAAMVPAALALGVFLLLRAALPELDGEWQADASGPAARVTLERDAAGVPTVRGTSVADVAYGLGVAHAQDRYFQMDLSRRLAAGELAALFGAVALPSDREARVFRFRAVARRVLAAASPAERAWLDAYARGVNEGLASLGSRPWEYWLLRTRPAPWLAEDSVLVLHSMWWQLQHSELRREQLRRQLQSQVAARLGAASSGRADAPAAADEGERVAAVLRLLFPAATEWDTPNFQTAAEAAASRTPVGGAVAPALPSARLLDLRTSAGAAPPRALPAKSGGPMAEGREKPGSNAWAVAGAHAAGGAALVANDMHLGLRVPAAWYQARMQVAAAEGAPPQLELNGVTLPGLPVLAAGSNGSIAWGFTNSYGDWSDVIRVRCEPARGRYWSDDGTEHSFERTTERIEVAGAEPLDLEVQDSAHGVMVEAVGADGHCWLARWLAQEPGATNLAALAFQQARDVDQALELAARTGMPQQNLVVGDRSGRIAWTIIGRVPRGTLGPRTPRPVAWRERNEQPAIIDPAAGRLWSANAKSVLGDAERVIGNDETDGGMSYDLGARARQIRDGLLALQAPATPADMLAIQLDDRALLLERWQRLLLGVLDPAAVSGSPQRAALRSVVVQWDGRAAVDSASYRVVREFREQARRATWQMLLGSLDIDAGAAGFQPGDFFEDSLWRLVTEQPPHLLGAGQPSWRAFMLEVADATAASLGAECPSLDECRWGARNLVQVRHPLSSSLGPLARWLDMPAVALPGDNDMPRVQAPRFGASERFAVAPGREAEGYLQLPGGQSGHPLSPFYRAGFDDWASGRPRSFLPGPSRHKLTILPGPRETP